MIKETCHPERISRPTRDDPVSAIARPPRHDSHRSASTPQARPHAQPGPRPRRLTRILRRPSARTVTRPPLPHLLPLPADWNFTRRDGEVSTFRLDARSAPRSANSAPSPAMPSTHSPPPPSPEPRLLQRHSRASPPPPALRRPRPPSPHRPRHHPAKTRSRRPLHPRLRRAGRHLHRSRDEIYTTFRTAPATASTSPSTTSAAAKSAASKTSPRPNRPVRNRQESILNTIRFDPK